VFSRDVPVILAPAQNKRTVAEVAQFLLDAGAINRRTFRSDCAGIHAECQSALNTWLSCTVGPLQCFTPHFDLQLVDQRDIHDAAVTHNAPQKKHADAGRVAICWREASVCHWGVGAGLDYLEQCVPALGSMVLDIMERKSAHAYPLFTPGVALDEASYLYWRGEADETLTLDEDCGDDQAARQAMADDMVTRAHIEAAFPPWALDYNRPRLPARELARIASGHACSYVRRAASLAHALHHRRTTALYWPEHDAPFIGFGAVLCWRDGDLAVQISDDYANHAWQGDYCEEIGTVSFSLDDPAAMRRWMRNVRPNLAAIGLLDRLLWHLTERE
jgi:PRTRC genetic system protein F